MELWSSYLTEARIRGNASSKNSPPKSFVSKSKKMCVRQSRVRHTHTSICREFSMDAGQCELYILKQKKNARLLRDRNRVRLSCVCNETSPILHHIDARASNARIWYEIPLSN
ncbi:hypothetical protein Y032_0005g2439 [Ancylostoma ceylanicum]|uniref:Uncharacterized protein n=1 Tax=Ancylostoma ceylanicum TaxID=53326 RepID=A0A016VS14_9BILA|nr:hypothetical protein Y032_0005g2439 [Ancylostoma ceylanicum]